MLRAIARGALALLTAVGSSALAAQTPAASTTRLPVADGAPDPLHQSGKYLSIYLLTMGNGEQVWELFGHNGIWVHDNVTQRDTVLNWGVFDFRAPHFILHFLQGRMWYAMGADSLRQIFFAYQYLNRTVNAQELDLSPTQKDSIIKQILWYSKPENVNYRYDYFGDNCSTRVRDILDNALHGQIHAAAGGLTGTTYRWHALRLMQRDKPIMLGVDIGLGRPSDHELTKWQEMFLPRKLHDFVGGLQVRDDSTGAMRPLVKSDRVLVQSTRGPEFAAPPRMWTWLLGAGIVIAALFAWLGAAARSGSVGAGKTAAIVFGVWAFVTGLLGLVVFLLWAVTDHNFAHSNENLFLFNPIWLFLLGPVAVSMWRGSVGIWTRRFAATVALLSLGALVMHLIGLSAQNNLALIGLMLPPALAIAWAVGVRQQDRVG